MIKHREDTSGYNKTLLSASKRRIDTLNSKFFKDVDLTEAEQSKLRWLCDWDQETIENIASAFEKAVQQSKKEL